MASDPSHASELRIIVEAGDSDGESGTGAKRKRRPAPCDIVSSVCARCQKGGQRCIRTASRIKFRHGSSAQYDTKGFSASQIWVKPNKSYVALNYIDETAQVAAIYGQEEVETNLDLDRRQPDEQRQGQGQQENESSRSQSGEADASELDTALTTTNGGDELAEGFQRHPTASFSTSDLVPLHQDSIQSVSQLGQVLWPSPFQNEPPTPFQSSRLRGFSGSQSSLPVQSPNPTSGVGPNPTPTSFLRGLVKTPSDVGAQTARSELELALLRYFIEVLACWFDICDPEKHFTLIVPHRARWCPPLKNAILAASARHLTRLCNPNSKPDFVYFHDGAVVPNLTEETALHYHSECIKDLLRRSMNAEQTQDVSLLAAAIILRFYEEIDAPLREDSSDDELFLRVMNVFIDAQIPASPVLPHSSPLITGPEIATDQNGSLIFPSQITHSPAASSHASGVNELPSHWRTDGLRQAGFWVAFRQEIHSAFLKQRPFNISLSRCEAFRSISPAEDAVWADRLIVFCAEVLEFCYDNAKGSASWQKPNQTPKDRWLVLKQCEKRWGEVLPASFEPIYFRDPDRSQAEVFPQVCYMVDCHVVGVQYVELARILLAVYDPTRPKLGPGYIASMRALTVELKAAVLRLCGIAMSNRKCPPALVTAYLGIALCGDRFEDPLEQRALLAFLDQLETGHGWPTGDTRQTLKEAWERP